MSEIETLGTLAVLGAGHWHVGGYLAPIRETPVKAVQVHDPSPQRAAEIAAKYPNARAASSVEAALDGADFALCCGEHGLMTDYLRMIVERRIPCVVEKPGALSAAELKPIIDKAASDGVFMQASLLQRTIDCLDRLPAGDHPVRMHIAYHAGPAARYVTWGNAWVLDKARAGGGVLSNLGTHLIDLALFLRPNLRVVSAGVSSARFNLPVEDWGAIEMLDPVTGDSALIEACYGPKETAGGWSVEWASPSLRTFMNAETMVDLATGKRMIEGKPVVLNHNHMIEDALGRMRRGEAPRASGQDLLNVRRVLDEAYAIASV